jgi:hypothetical protein
MRVDTGDGGLLSVVNKEARRLVPRLKPARAGSEAASVRSSRKIGQVMPIDLICDHVNGQVTASQSVTGRLR